MVYLTTMSSSSYPCHSCSFVGLTPGALRYHRTSIHDQVCVLLKGVKSFTVHRKDGIFTCEHCGGFSGNSRKFAVHSACYLGENSKTPLVTVEATALGEQKVFTYCTYSINTCMSCLIIGYNVTLLAGWQYMLVQSTRTRTACHQILNA